MPHLPREQHRDFDWEQVDSVTVLARSQLATIGVSRTLFIRRPADGSEVSLAMKFSGPDPLIRSFPATNSLPLASVPKKKMALCGPVDLPWKVAFTVNAT